MKNQEILFDIDPTLILKGLRGVYLAIHDVKNRESDPILKGYRDLHTAFSFTNRNFPAVLETLIEKFVEIQTANVNWIPIG